MCVRVPLSFEWTKVYVVRLFCDWRESHVAIQSHLSVTNENRTIRMAFP